MLPGCARPPSGAVDALVVGAGVVGLAVARSLALAGREVLVVEAADTFGTETSSRNSEVIHSGLYYPPGSLRETLCVEGKRRLYAYCAERGIQHRRLGKLLVAANEQQERALREYQRQAPQHGLQWLDGAEARRMEPELACRAALLSPSTGIVDSHQLMRALLADTEAAGGRLAVSTRVVGGEVTGAAKRVRLQRADGGGSGELQAGLVVNAAGLGAQAVSQCLGVPSSSIPQQHLAKGNYFSLSGSAPFSRLIYPMPGAGGLGIHLTLDLAGAAKFGPDVQFTDAVEYAVDPARAEGFYRAIRSYWPGLPDGALQPAYSGIRPKLHGPGEPQADFLVDSHTVPGLVSLYGIESPGLTSCLALGELVTQRLLQAR